MKFEFEASRIAELLAKQLRATLTLENHTFTFVIALGDRSRSLQMPKARLDGLISAIEAKELSDETGLYSDTSYEILVSEEGPFPGRRLREDGICTEEAESGLRYEISSVSDEYLIWLLCSTANQSSPRDLGIGFFFHRLQREAAASETTGVIELLRAISVRLLALRITSVSKQNIRRFQVAANSFLFHVAYNLDLAFVPQRYLEELSRRGRISRMRRSTVAELDPPRRSYNDDLVNHYLLAISTDSPTVQYLSYYHVIEHFFEAIFNDDLIDQIKVTLTQPGFSFKRKKDIGSLIQTIKRSLQIRSETITFSEYDALRLVLRKFVNISELVTKLNEYDQNLLSYYQSFEVPFSKGSAVALVNGQPDQINRELAKRIYATRNALVHSKDGDKARYIPFKDERALVKEIPLLRFVSEAIILQVSEIG